MPVQPHHPPAPGLAPVPAVGGEEPEAARHQEVPPVLAGQHPGHLEGDEDHVTGGADHGVVHHTAVTLLGRLLLPLHLRDEDPRHLLHPLPHLAPVLAKRAVQHRLTRPPRHADVGEPDLDPLAGGPDHLEPAGDVLLPSPPVEEHVPGGGEAVLLVGVVAAPGLLAPVLHVTALLPPPGHELVPRLPVQARHHRALPDGLGERQASPSGEVALGRSADPAAAAGVSLDHINRLRGQESIYLSQLNHPSLLCTGPRD